MESMNTSLIGHLRILLVIINNTYLTRLPVLSTHTYMHIYLPIHIRTPRVIVKIIPRHICHVTIVDCYEMMALLL